MFYSKCSKLATTHFITFMRLSVFRSPGIETYRCVCFVVGFLINGVFAAPLNMYHCHPEEYII